MTLVEAVKSGQKFKRKGAADWFNYQTTGNTFTADDLQATDWFTMTCPVLTKDLTMEDLEAAFVAVNVAAPFISRPAFRELVSILCGVTIK